MRTSTLFLLLACLCTTACTDQSAGVSDPVSRAEAVLDAFYVWDADRLRQATAGIEGQAALLYYQAWAEAAHYTVDTRKPCVADGSQVICRVTVYDDFGGALGYRATDTFTFTADGERLSSVVFAGDDPPVFAELFEWIGIHRSEVLTGPCKDMFAGGTTPAACARAVAQAARNFAASR